MKLSPNQIKFIHKCKKLYKILGCSYPGSGKGYFKHNGVLDCSCGMCNVDTYEKKWRNKKQRFKNKQELKQLIHD